VVLISPIGYSASGEVFNLAAKQVATEVAIALQADKLILLTDYSCTKKQSLIQQMTVDEVQDYLQQQKEITPALFDSLTAAIKSCQQGVYRVHLIDRKIDGALLLELFTRDGTGTLISSNSFEEIRSAHLDDIGGILELIKPLEQQGLLIKRSREKLEIEINDYIIIERDGLVIGCIAFHLLNDNKSAEIACLAIHTDYQNSSRGSQLLDYLIKKAESKKLTTLFVLSTQTMHWFIERGFKPTKIDTLPKHRQEFYNYSRNSKVLYRSL
jgi:amino-acid N-acetyltransferase